MQMIKRNKMHHKLNMRLKSTKNNDTAFIKANDFYINPAYIVSIYTWTACTGFIHYVIRYYNKFNNLEEAEISKNDYNYLIGQRR